MSYTPDYAEALHFLILRMSTASNIHEAREFCIDAAKAARFCDDYDPTAFYYYHPTKHTVDNMIEPGTLDHLAYYLRYKKLTPNEED